MSDKSRDYKKEYQTYQGTEIQKKRRAKRNHDRRQAERDGKVHKGDGNDIHHAGPNLTRPTVRDKSANRADKKKR